MLVRWTEPAVDDITQICDYTQDRFGPAQSRRAAIAIYDSVESLRTFPHKGRPGRKLNTRELDCPTLPFAVIYRLREGVVEVSRILHRAQKWP